MTLWCDFRRCGIFIDKHRATALNGEAPYGAESAVIVTML
jgi:hypothetical protein